MKRMLAGLAIALCVLIAVLVLRTLQFVPPERGEHAPLAAVEWSSERLAEGLAAAIRIPTISYADPEAVDQQTFDDFHRFLQQRFPRVFTQLAARRFGNTLMLHWPGQRAQAKPVMLIAHQDVVPVIPGTEADWRHPPFGGTRADGYIWGRGALDDKASLMGILEATERLLGEGFVPPRDIYLGFGADEEVGGEGAKAMANWLAERGVSLAFLLDEGGAIAKGMLPGVDAPLALIGPAEKGFLSLEFSAAGSGGHSSMPPPQTAAGIVAAAVARLEANPLPATLDYTVDFMRYLGDAIPFYQRLMFANTWLFGPVLEQQMAKQPAVNAGLRTTTAVTMLQGSVQDNVLPIKASAVVNFRILPGDSVESVIEAVTAIVDDPRVSIRPYGGFGSNPSKVASPESAGFRVLAELVSQIAPGAIVAPRLVIAATDARHFEAVAENSYRFVGFEIGPEEMAGIHGTNERVSESSYVQAVNIYYHLLRRAGEL